MARLVRSRRGTSSSSSIFVIACFARAIRGPRWLIGDAGQRTCAPRHTLESRLPRRTRALPLAGPVVAEPRIRLLTTAEGRTFAPALRWVGDAIAANDDHLVAARKHLAGEAAPATLEFPASILVRARGQASERAMSRRTANPFVRI